MKLKPEELDTAIIKPCTGTDYFVVRHPYFGSGKISRRVYLGLDLISSRRNRKAKKQYASSVLESPPRSTGFSFPNKSVKQIFLLWNRLGYPFVPHKQQRSKTTARIFSLLNPICKKYETRQIADALRDGHSLFTTNSFVYRHIFNKQKIGLHTFLALSTAQQELYRKYDSVRKIAKVHGIFIPNSWFDECRKGFKYLQDTYCVANKLQDDYPEITQQAIKALQSHWQRELNDLGKEKMVKFSRMLVNFCGMHDPPIKDPGWLMDRIEDWLTVSHKLKIQKAYYMTTQSFWFNDIPDCMRNWDPITYRQRNWNFDKDKLFQ